MAAAPPPHRAVRNVVHEARRVASGSTPTHEHLRDRLVALLAITVAVDVVCSVLVFLLERHTPGTQVKSFGDAVFFASTQLLSVSSSLTNPISAGGRILDIAMELYAITVVAFLAGSAGTFLHRRSFERHQAEAQAAAGDAAG